MAAHGSRASHTCTFMLSSNSCHLPSCSGIHKYKQLIWLRSHRKSVIGGRDHNFSHSSGLARTDVNSTSGNVASDCGQRVDHISRYTYLHAGRKVSVATLSISERCETQSIAYGQVNQSALTGRRYLKQVEVRQAEHHQEQKHMKTGVSDCALDERNARGICRSGRSVLLRCF